MIAAPPARMLSAMFCEAEGRSGTIYVKRNYICYYDITTNINGFQTAADFLLTFLLPCDKIGIYFNKHKRITVWNLMY